MKSQNRHFRIEFNSCSENESFARGVLAAFLVPLDPTVDEVTEIKTAVSEAVSNSVIHGYRGGEGVITMVCDASADGHIRISISDEGCGIEDIEQAREPLFSTNTDGERSGMGFTVMESFMDHVNVRSEPGKGTEVIMTKNLDVGYEL
jgi:stage II sporulation protein AB (anti-sigma F factor)